MYILNSREIGLIRRVSEALMLPVVSVDLTVGPHEGWGDRSSPSIPAGRPRRSGDNEALMLMLTGFTPPGQVSERILSSGTRPGTLKPTVLDSPSVGVACVTDHRDWRPKLRAEQTCS